MAKKPKSDLTAVSGGGEKAQKTGYEMEECQKSLWSRILGVIFFWL